MRIRGKTKITLTIEHDNDAMKIFSKDIDLLEAVGELNGGIIYDIFHLYENEIKRTPHQYKLHIGNTQFETTGRTVKHEMNFSIIKRIYDVD